MSKNLAAIPFLLLSFFCAKLWADQPATTAQVTTPASRQSIISQSLDAIEQLRSLKYLASVTNGISSLNPINMIKSEVSKLNIHGSVSTDVARHLDGGDRFSMLKTQLFLNASGELTDSLKYRISGLFSYDAVYDLFNYYPKNVGHDQKWEEELRDTYIDYSNGPWDIRLGKQQIVWGEAIGLFYADVVNAKDLRDYILPDFDLIRIPEWGADLEYGNNDFHSESVFIPAPAVDRLGVPGAPFAFPYPAPGAYTTEDPKKPVAGFYNSKLGERLSYMINGLDLEAFYLYSWTESPVYFRTIDPLGVFHFTPEYKRLSTMGTSFSDEINDTILKGEFVLTANDYFPTSDPSSANGIAQSDHLDYFLGAQHTFFQNLDVNFQFMQRVIFDYKKSFINEHRISNSVSFSVDKEFLNNKLDAQFLVIAGVSTPDFLYRPSIKYNITDNWQAKIGMDIFAGAPRGIFGLFKNQSTYYGELTWKF